MMPGSALTCSRGSTDSGLRPRAAAPALGTRRRHRHRQRDEASRMPTSGATRRTELGMSLKSSLVGGGKQGRGGFGGATPPPPPPSPTPPGYPYLVTPMCRARTSQVLPAGKRGGAEFGRPRVGRLPAHPEQAASPCGEHPTSMGTQDGVCAQCSIHRAGTLAWHSAPLVLGTQLGPRRASAAPQHPDGWDPCTHVLPCWGSSPRALWGGGEAWESKGAGGRGQAALAPRTHSWAPAAGPGWAACIGIFGKRSGRGGRGCWSPEEL